MARHLYRTGEAKGGIRCPQAKADNVFGAIGQERGRIVCGERMGVQRCGAELLEQESNPCFAGDRYRNGALC